VEVARQTGLGQTVVGTLFVALSTTLPELVVSISATGGPQSTSLSAISSAATSSTSWSLP
jgi:Ca2+/Na+ antiporter